MRIQREFCYARHSSQFFSVNLYCIIKYSGMNSVFFVRSNVELDWAFTLVSHCSCVLFNISITFAIELCPVTQFEANEKNTSIFRSFMPHTQSERALNTYILIASITPCKMLNAFSVFSFFFLAADRYPSHKLHFRKLNMYGKWEVSKCNI